MKNLHLSIIIFFLFTLHTKASEFQVNGYFQCSIGSDLNHPNANIQLWEEDMFPPDDYMGETVVRQHQFYLKFDQFELDGVEPYLVVRHDCVPEWWSVEGRKTDEYKFCYVQERRQFQEPDGPVAHVNVRVGDNDYKNMEICVPEGEFYRLFAGAPRRFT